MQIICQTNVRYTLTGEHLFGIIILRGTGVLEDGIMKKDID